MAWNVDTHTHETTPLQPRPSLDESIASRQSHPAVDELALPHAHPRRLARLGVSVLVLTAGAAAVAALSSSSTAGATTPAAPSFVYTDPRLDRDKADTLNVTVTNENE